MGASLCEKLIEIARNISSSLHFLVQITKSIRIKKV